MHPEDIKAAVRKRGVTFVDIAKHLKCPNSTLSFVLHGKRRDERIADTIAALVGKPKEAIWPGVYEAKKAKPTVGELLAKKAA